VRDALSEISEMPQRVVDPNWVERLDEHVENEAAKRPRRAAKF
jgi:hypothetical protein